MRLTDTLAKLRSLSSHYPKTLGAMISMVVFSVVVVSLFAPVWSEGASRSVPITASDKGPISPTEVADVKFEVLLVARHARAFLTGPDRLFDTEHCAPLENTLTYGIPMFTMGLLGIPGYLAFNDPLLTYNSALVLWVLFAAIAMYSLVTAWTGSVVAGIVAATLYAFHPTRLLDITHPSVVDTTWTVFSLLFAQRLFAHGRWRDAIGLGISGGLLIAASFYPFVAAVFLSLPYVAWILFHYRPHRVQILQLTLVTAIIGITAVFVFGPYIEAREASDTLRRIELYYAPWYGYLRGEWLYPGAVVLALAAVGLAAPRKYALPGLSGDPRWALALGATLVAIMAAGPYTNITFQRILGPMQFEIPNLYGLMATVVPGFDTIRGVARLALTVQVVLSILAGMGAAVLLRSFGRRSTVASVVLVGFVVIYAQWPNVLGLERPFRWETVRISPSPQKVQFFSDLAALGNQGPMLELPAKSGLFSLIADPNRILLTFYHRRRTSACFGSYTPDREQLMLAIDDLSSAESKETLRQMGFTTVIYHHLPNAHIEPTGEHWRLLLSGRVLTAYSLDEPSSNIFSPGSN
jgi:hypothetical protein